jgi:phage anti-repressor protein
MQNFDDLTRVFLDETDGNGDDLSSAVEKTAIQAVNTLSLVEDEEGNNEFSKAFKEIYEEYLKQSSDKYKISDDYKEKLEEAKIFAKINLEDTFAKLMN